MRYRENWTLYRRKVGKRSVWYFRTCDEYGQRTPGRSTGKTSKTLANDYCAQLFRDGRLLATSDLPFSEYALNWWTWGKSEYIRSRNDRSEVGNPAISERYADEMARIMATRVLPAFKGMKLSAITPRGLYARLGANRPLVDECDTAASRFVQPRHATRERDNILKGLTNAHECII